MSTETSKVVEYNKHHVPERTLLMIQNTEIFGDTTIIPTYFYYHLLHWSEQAMELHEENNTELYKSMYKMIKELQEILLNERERIMPMCSSY